MVLMDFVLISAILGFAALGVMLGFGRSLRFLTMGLGGVIISVVVCYFVFGALLSIGFVSNALAAFRQALADNGSGFCSFLLTIRIDIIVYAIILFVIVQLIRTLIVYLIALLG